MTWGYVLGNLMTKFSLTVIKKKFVGSQPLVNFA